MAEEEIPVLVEGVLMSTQGPVVMLAVRNGAGAPPADEAGADAAAAGEPALAERVLPIFIDHSQALHIQLALEGQLSPRPMTHDLMSAVMNELGAVVQRVVIEELAQSTFYASLWIEIEREGENRLKRFDARPSDCIALAVRVGAPIHVTRKLLDQASIHRKDVGPPAGEEVEMVDASEGEDEPGDIDLGVPR